MSMLYCLLAYMGLYETFSWKCISFVSNRELGNHKLEEAFSLNCRPHLFHLIQSHLFCRAACW